VTWKSDDLLSSDKINCKYYSIKKIPFSTLFTADREKENIYKKYIKGHSLGKSNQVVRSSFKLKEKIHVRGFNY
jgi:hypothetical protein